MAKGTDLDKAIVVFNNDTDEFVEAPRDLTMYAFEQAKMIAECEGWTDFNWTIDYPSPCETNNEPSHDQ